ncbi:MULTISPECIES: hypothetical protein [Streptomyces]|uniref:hypothetical protein n=1 Tax=Streptomyces TaxID=1883 RepID=UPI001E4F40E8|nr:MULTISPECIES: hypothetical protein [Streptomyces]UFQ14612.1 hypothetical protein J2N69_06035 [Streptomyces huasconensis]WCL84213.1 hypothetical protein PPN52_06035 [Streptomyces sp. JCM 35825]
MTTDGERAVVPEELAELRRSLDVGLARVDGRLALLTQHDQQTAKNVEALQSRVSALEHTRWPLPTIVALATVAALAVAVWQALGH